MNISSKIIKKKLIIMKKNKKEKNDKLLIKYNDKLSNYFHKLKKYRKMILKLMMKEYFIGKNL